MALVKTIHQGTLNSIRTKSFDRLHVTNALVSALEEDIDAQSSLSQDISMKDMSSGKIENLAGNDKHLVAFLSQLDTWSSFEASDDNSAAHDKQKSHTAGKMTKRLCRQTERKSKRDNHLSSSSPASDTETGNISPDFCEKASNFGPKCDRVHLSK